MFHLGFGELFILLMGVAVIIAIVAIIVVGKFLRRP